MINLKNVKGYCKDYTKIENYKEAVADTTQIWDCHHKLELVKTGAVVDTTKKDLIDWGIYYNRPADELIFLTRADHYILHNKGKSHKGKPHSEEWKREHSEAMKGRTFSEEAKRMMSAAKKGKHWKLVDGKRVWY